MRSLFSGRQDFGQMNRLYARAATGGAPRRRCIRHELSAAAQTSARVLCTQRSLSESIAAETSAFLTAKVPAETAALVRL